ncbi:CHASE2 domain-containing protein [Rugamonas sp. FT81W]|uniref:CHASE2 domain-containing protein n=1 Tax=Duganella vulcania TaxID=2692166 RepID=A0A845GXY8_9BURK|nr:CHASE2 domain-containing protein [Duganella vulcania]
MLRIPFTATAVARSCIALAALLITAWVQWDHGGASQRLDNWLRDRYTLMRASAQPEQRMLLVDIDETSLERYPWPWPRTRMAEMVEALLADGARGVALDILQEKAADAAGDARMTMLSQHAPLVLAQLFDFGERDDPLHSGVLSGGEPGALPGAVPAYGYIANHAGLAQAAHFGNIGVAPDSDGVLRRVPMYTSFNGRSYPTLSRALFDCCAAGRPLPATATGWVRIPYTRAWPAYEVAKAADLLDQRVPPEFIQGRLVLIGSSALSIGDRVATPLGALSAGLMVHASMLTGLLDRQAGLAPAPWPGSLIALLFCLAVTALSIYTLPRRTAAVNIALLAAGSALWLPLAYLIAPHDAGFGPSGPLLSILFLLLVAVPFHWQQAQTRSRRLLDTLRQYVAGDVVDELLRSNLEDPLAPRQLEVTTLIADMEGYTTHVESLPVEEAARLTTEFLDCLTRPVLAMRGTLDKYTGDGMVAFWGAPLPNPDHANLALDAARAMLQAVRHLNARRAAAGQPALRVRIGIESGLAMAGDFGTAMRSIYTAVGDSVNTASRLEQAARDYPYDIIIGEGTVSRASRHRFRQLGQRTLRGKEHPINLYTLEDAPCAP